MCLFYNKRCIQFLKLFLQSLEKYGNLNKDNTDILVITSNSFYNDIIQNIENIDIPVKFWLVNEIDNIMDSACYRLNIFDYKDIAEYSKILYVDTDVLVCKDINIIFNLSLDDKLYAIQEGTVSDEWHGAEFFNFTSLDKETPAFNSGVLLFNNNAYIQKLFKDIKNHIIDNNGTVTSAYDQNYIVYNAIIQNMYNNELLSRFLALNPNRLTDKVLYHFPGALGSYERKIKRIKWFIEKTGLELN